jgi:hypothetical protein
MDFTSHNNVVARTFFLGQLEAMRRNPKTYPAKAGTGIVCTRTGERAAIRLKETPSGLFSKWLGAVSPLTNSKSNVVPQK